MDRYKSRQLVNFSFGMVFVISISARWCGLVFHGFMEVHSILYVLSVWFSSFLHVFFNAMGEFHIFFSAPTLLDLRT